MVIARVEQVRFEEVDELGSTVRGEEESGRVFSGA